ncbi:putative GPI-anchored protein [Apostasia shenzhenica]|uniref:Putative GPI-anchored protein n=1 Tax=Apostasia shenzhenica TaxID=1088818 RepID=A0A2H9ZTV6_9ASPA|nr:putative GPI-anchored protein [Apostasia shenzhenica]
MCIVGLQELFCILDNVVADSSLRRKDIKKEKQNIILPYVSPTGSPRPLIPLLAPSPLSPFMNNSPPKLSGQCLLNFSAVDSLMKTTAIDCYTSFAPLLANVICCPQLHATLTILLGQSSKDTGILALDSAHTNYCLSDVQEILGSHGANYELREICSIHPSNLTGGSCPLSDISGVESAIDSSKVLAACKNVDPVNECCSKVCQNAIHGAAMKISMRDGSSRRTRNTDNLTEQASIIDDCKNIILRWLSSRLDTLSATQLLRRVSNCNVNRVCPLVFPDTTSVAKDCGSKIKNRTSCCNAMKNYVTHLQKQSFITNLQAVDCAENLGIQLQKVNVSKEVYTVCQITLKDFSLLVGSQESGCLLPSLPSDATLDSHTGIGFTCDLNDNIAAPWPSGSQTTSNSCNQSTHYPELPAATSAQFGGDGNIMKLNLATAFFFFFFFILL